YGFTPDASWHWTSARGWLEVVPGATAAVGGLVMIISPSRLVVALGGALAAVAGAWFVVGPSLAGVLRIGSLGTPISDRPGLASRASGGLFSGPAGAILVLVAFVPGRPSARDFGSRARGAADEPLLPIAAVAPVAVSESRGRWEGVAVAA